MAKKKRQTKAKKSSKKRTKKGTKSPSIVSQLKKLLTDGWRWLFNWIKQTWTRRITAVLLALLFVVVLGMYAVAQWYIISNQDRPYIMGATFIQPYAEFYGLDPEETLTAITDDLGFEHLRLVSYWNVHEPEQGEYDFTDLDWQFEHAEERDISVSLAIGLRQPRWPECHMPTWAEHMEMEEWYPHLKDYMEVVIDRYKDSPVLVSYQLENEFLLEVFGHCPDHTRERLVDSFNFVKELDPTRPVIVSRSNNATPSWPVGEPRADIIGASIYKRVWDGTLTERYFEYPLPPWFYAFLAGGAKLTTGVDTVIHELQAESWLPRGMDMRTASTEELYKSMNPDMLADRFEYGRATAIREIDLWGVEWWYSRKVNDGDSSLWDVAREQLRYTDQLNQEIVN